MKTPVILLAALLSSGAAFAQTTTTTPTSTATSGSTATPAPTRSESVNDSNPLTPAAPADRIATMKDGASISNNRDRLSPGTGTPATMATDRAVERANGDQPKKGKSKTKQPR